jgi:AcrR family transcriptional regulator
MKSDEVQRTRASPKQLGAAAARMGARKHPEVNHRTIVGRSRRARTRARIIGAAALVFAQRGANGAVIEEFIRAAGVSRGTFYYYFSTTDELLEATIGWLSDDVIRAVDPVIRDIDDVVLRLSMAMRLYLRWVCSNPSWCAFVAKIPRVGSLARLRIVRDLEQGRRIGAFNVPSSTAAFDLVVGVPAQAIVRMAEGGSMDLCEDTCRIVLQGLGVKPRKIAQVMLVPLPPLPEPVRSHDIFGGASL